MFSNRKKYLFYVESNWDLTFDKEIKSPEKCEIKVIGQGLTICYISIETLVGHLNYSNSGNEVFENIFGRKNLSKKDFDVIYQNSLFVFADISWINVLFHFKLNGIDISSGNITKRHIITPIQIQLINFVYEIYQNGLDNNIVYEVYKGNLLSQTISENIQFRLIDSNNEYIRTKTLE